MGIGDAASVGRKKRRKKKKKKRSQKLGAPPGAQPSNSNVVDLSVRPDYQDLDAELLEAAEEFAKLSDRIKKLDARKKELAALLKEEIPENGVNGKFLPLADGRKVTVYKSKGQPKVGKGTLVEEFGKSGAEFWANAERAPDYIGVSVKN